MFVILFIIRILVAQTFSDIIVVVTYCNCQYFLFLWLIYYKFILIVAYFTRLHVKLLYFMDEALRLLIFVFFLLLRINFGYVYIWEANSSLDSDWPNISFSCFLIEWARLLPLIFLICLIIIFFFNIWKHNHPFVGSGATIFKIPSSLPLLSFSLTSRLLSFSPSVSILLMLDLFLFFRGTISKEKLPFFTKSYT